MSPDDDILLFPYKVVKTVDDLQYIPETKQGGDGFVWPDKSLVGYTGEDAKWAILAMEPSFIVHILPEDNTIMTMDYKSSRVRIFVDVNGKVTRQPIVG